MSYQSDALGRRIRYSFRGRPEWKQLWDAMEQEYRRTTQTPSPNTIGMLADMAAECYATWVTRESAR